MIGINKNVDAIVDFVFLARIVRFHMQGTPIIQLYLIVDSATKVFYELNGAIEGNFIGVVR